MTFSHTQRPHPTGITVEYAGFWIRVGAHLIDAIILGAIFLAIMLAIAYAQGAMDNGQIVPATATTVQYLPYAPFANVLVLALMSLPYHVGFWVWRGQTPGKMALNIKIVRSDGIRIGPGTAIIRFIGWFFTEVLAWVLYLWIAIDARKQGLHDKLAATCVVKLPPKTARMMSIDE